MSNQNLVDLIERLLERAADAAAEKFGVAELLREAAKAIGAMVHAPKAEAGKGSWQSIETAPKDNQRKLYLACFNDKGELEDLDFDGGWGRWVRVGWSWEVTHINGCCWVSANGLKEPTHWTHWSYQDEPLPSSPVQPHPEHLALLRGKAQEAEPRAPQRCSMGVGCDEAGVCYAAAHGESDRCGRTEELHSGDGEAVWSYEPILAGYQSNGYRIKAGDEPVARVTTESPERDEQVAELIVTAVNAHNHSTPVPYVATLWGFVAEAFDHSKTSTSERILDDLGLPMDHPEKPFSWHIKKALAAQDRVCDEAATQPGLGGEQAVGTVLGGIFHYLRSDHGLPDNTKLYTRPSAGKVEAAIFIQFTEDGKHIRFWTRDHARALEETFCHARPLTSFYNRPAG